MLNEQLLQFIWQYGLFKSSDLLLKDESKLLIVSKGKLNKDAGPDFLNAKIKIDETIWAGNIEIHLKASDWYKHNHQESLQYQNIILHVVFENDLENDIGNFPTLALKDYIDNSLLQQYEQLMYDKPTIACSFKLSQVPSLIWNHWLERMLSEKWEQKFDYWNEKLQQNQNDWRQLFYLVLAKTLGSNVNGEMMEQLAAQTPLSVLAKHKNELIHVESILFGQAGLIPENPVGEYETALQLHYAFFKQKYQLEPLQSHNWKFMRMRPANFPTIRIAQLAMIIHHQEHLFDKLMQTSSPNDLDDLFDFGVSEYWEHHYTFQNESKQMKKPIGATLQHLIWINVVAPLRYFYAKHQGNTQLENEATSLLERCPIEKNSIISTWNDVNVIPKNAAESQALIYLYKSYCSAKKCLQCSVGHWVLKN